MKTRRSKGFTLIEILIVVVILAILAAMILPRMMGQIERGEKAEAFQWMGVIRRASANLYAQTGSFTGYLYAQADNSFVLGSWGDLGLKDPGGLRNWGVYYYGLDTYHDIWVGDVSWGNYIHASGDGGGEVWDCGGAFQYKTNAAGDVIGCTI